MDELLHSQVDAHVEELRVQLHALVNQIFSLSSGMLLLELEKRLFGLFMTFGGGLVSQFLEAFHRDRLRIQECQEQAHQKGLCNSGWRFTPIYLLFGGRHKIRTPYAVSDCRGRQGRRRGRGRRGRTGSGCYPVLEALGCRANATPALLSEVGSQLGWGPSEAAAQVRLKERGIPLDSKTLRRMFYALADEGIAQRSQALDQRAIPAGSQGESLAGKRAVITFDGGRIRTRKQRRGHRRESGYHGFDGPWQEPRLLVIYTLDEKGRKQRQELPLYDGVLTSANRLFQLVKQYLLALNAAQAELLVFVADGAPEHWDAVTELIQVLGLAPKQVVEVLDWAHAIEHLTKALDACGNLSQKQRESWLDKQRKRLKKGQLSLVLSDLESLCRGRRASKIRKEIDYLEKHAHRLRYDQFQKAGIPLGSGAVESAIRRVVNLRMKGNGIFWKTQNAERMLFLRCQLLSGRWQAFIQNLLCTCTASVQPVPALPFAA